MSKTAILILAAGSSSRMGKAKQLLAYKHTTLLGWAIEQAQASKFDKVVCVLGANIEVIKKSIKKYSVKTILNTQYESGLSSSIVSGIKELLDTDAVLVMLADQPNVTAAYLNQLLEISFKNPDKIIASNYNNVAGVPALFPKKYYGKLLNLKGDKGAKEFLNKEINKTIKLNGGNLIDIDLPEDYNKLKQ